MAPAMSSYPRMVWPPRPEAAARAVRRSVTLATLRSEDRGSLGQQIFDETAIAIVEGRLQPGQTLNSVELAERFATSRTPVREALVELERQGAVIVAPHQRPRVAQPTLTQLRDIYELRASLFTLVSELIVDNVSEAGSPSCGRGRPRLRTTPRAATSMTTSGTMRDSGW